MTDAGQVELVQKGTGFSLLVTKCHLGYSTTTDSPAPVPCCLSDCKGRISDCKNWKEKQKYASNLFGILINCSTAVHQSETKQQYLTLGCLPERVSPADAAQIKLFLGIQGIQQN